MTHNHLEYCLYMNKFHPLVLISLDTLTFSFIEMPTQKAELYLPLSILSSHQLCSACWTRTFLDLGDFIQTEHTNLPHLHTMSYIFITNMPDNKAKQPDTGYPALKKKTGSRILKL